ncbi:MAG: LamG-like jellyroll fold domain-containing protein [Candidatus Paceibacterota bacterium]|jgi:prepilin-type N-terminal cleavage/methylation domain-containing protein
MNRKGFTLIELLVVIAIVGILSSVIYTNITGLRDRARITAGIRFDSSTLHSIGDMLVGEWLFDTNTSPTPDTSGNNNIGTLSATPPTWQQTGGYNSKGAYSFNGTSNYITIPTISISNNITVSAWIYSSNFNQNGFVVFKEPVNSQWALFFESPYFEWRGVTASLTCSPPSNNTWHHIVGTQSGTLAELYIDGTRCNSSGAITTIGNGTGNIYIGAYTGGYFFSGLIDQVRIYSSALSSSEIQKLYTEGISSHLNLANK